MQESRAQLACAGLLRAHRRRGKLRCLLLGVAALTVGAIATTFGPAVVADVTACECVQTGGVNIPIRDAVHLARDCVTVRRYGDGILDTDRSAVLQEAHVDIESPTVSVWFAYENIARSKLAFNRAAPQEERYAAVVGACDAYRADFLNAKNWQF